MNALNQNDLVRLVPSAFADRPAEGASHRYQFIPTAEVICILESDGWVPVQARQALVRTPERQGFQRHMIRFRHRDQSKVTVGDSVAEIVLINSHDRTSAYQLHAGLFRLVCSNGLVVSDATFGRVSIRHVGFDKQQVLEASYRILDHIPKITDAVAVMRGTTLSQDQRLDLARQALSLKWTDGKAPIEPLRLLIPRRFEDHGSDLWGIYNVIQENLMQGGIAGFSTTMRRIRTRAVTSIPEQIGINKGLWDLAMGFTEKAPALEIV